MIENNFYHKFRFQIEDQINMLTRNQNKQQNCLIIQQLYFRDILSSKKNYFLFFCF